MNLSLHPQVEDDVQAALDAVTSEPRLVSALRRADELRAVVAVAARPIAVADTLAAAIEGGDDVVALAAIHAIGAVVHQRADQTLVDLVTEAEEPYAAHAAWVLGARRAQPTAVSALTNLVGKGGIAAMLAERTLIEWSRQESQRRRDRWTSTAQVESLSTRSEQRTARDDGIVVVQPCLHARLDPTGRTLGSGDSGGIASLLRTLGPVLSAQPSIAEVVTVTRSNDGESREELLAPGHRIARLAIGPDGPLPAREAWQHRVAAERQLTELGRSLLGRRVVWHLRMADVGSLAAASVARRLGQPMVFTAAPDPHVVIDALQDAGRLHRNTFAVEDAAHHYWFRARMVERIAWQADQLVLLPRPTIRAELRDYVGIEDVALDQRAVAVPEGVDVEMADEARIRMARGGPADVVSRVLSGMPQERRGLPWLLTVGRLHPSKGAHRLVEAVAADASLAGAVNIVIVGGGLDHPTADEQSTIERIRRAERDAPDGLVTMTGNLPPLDVADLLAFVSARGGVYVCASDKEEFGLAIVEALAAGAVVVVPRRGGPQTYVVDGESGVVCDTTSATSLHDGIVRARSLIGRSGRREEARRMVRADLSIERMAAALGAVYRRVAPTTTAA